MLMDRNDNEYVKYQVGIYILFRSEEDNPEAAV
jgi:hypothetical protein